MRLLLALVCALLFTQSSLAEAPADQTAAAPVEEIKPLEPGRVEIYLEDLHCKTCAKKVSRKLYALRGVSKVETYLKTDLVVVRVPKKQPVATAALWQAVLDGGVKPTELRYAEVRLDVEAMKEVLQQASLEQQTK